MTSLSTATPPLPFCPTFPVWGDFDGNEQLRAVCRRACQFFGLEASDFSIGRSEKAAQCRAFTAALLLLHAFYDSGRIASFLDMSEADVRSAGGLFRSLFQEGIDQDAQVEDILRKMDAHLKWRRPSLLNRFARPAPDDKPRIDHVLNVVAAYADASNDVFTGARRDPGSLLLRQIATYACRYVLGASFPEIGRALGGRSHATVIHTMENVEKRLGLGDAPMPNGLGLLNLLDEMAKRIPELRIMRGDGDIFLPRATGFHVIGNT